MSIGPPIPEIQHFQNLTLKMKGQGHGWGHILKSQCGSNILSTHFPFVPCQSGILFLSYDFFKVWPWKSKVKVMGEVDIESHDVDLAYYRLTSLSFHVNRHDVDLAYYRLTSLSFHVNRPPPPPPPPPPPFLRYSIFIILPWKSRFKVKWPWCCTTIGLDNSIELRMV